MHIGSYCFNNCKVFKSLVIYSSSLSIGICCFEGCKELTNVSIRNPNLQLDFTKFEGTPFYFKIKFSHLFQEIDGELPFHETYCPICREDFNENNKPVIIRKCKHAFCRDCVSTIDEMFKICSICNQTYE
jgi:hypothetical protein